MVANYEDPISKLHSLTYISELLVFIPKMQAVIGRQKGGHGPRRSMRRS